MKKIKLLVKTATKILMLLMIAINAIPLYVFADTDSSIQIVSEGGETLGDGISVSKTIKPTEIENFFDITLSVDTKQVVKDIEVPPASIAIVLVVDESYSMKYCMNSQNDCSSNNTHRLQYLKQALLGTSLDGNGGFLKEFIDKSVNTDTIRELGLVGFGQNLDTTSTRYQDLIDINEVGTTTFKNTFTTKIKNLVASDMGTNPAPGLAKAREMLSHSDATNKYIIFLTDGLPTRHYNNASLGATTGTLNSTYTGAFYDDYSAYYARREADANKAAGIKTYTIGVGVDGVPTYENGTGSDGKGNNNKAMDGSTYKYEVGYIIESSLGFTDASNTNDLSTLVGKEIFITSSNDTNYFMSAGDNLGRIQKGDTVNDSTIWILEKKNNNYVLKNKETGKYLGRSNDRGGRNNNYYYNATLVSFDNALDFSLGKNGNNVNLSIRVDDTTYYLTYNDNAWRFYSNNNRRVKFYTSGSIETYKTGPDQFKLWLGGNAQDDTDTNSGRGIGYVTEGQAYYDATDSQKLSEAYEEIFKNITVENERIAQVWQVDDAMNSKNVSANSKYIDFVYFMQVEKNSGSCTNKNPSSTNPACYTSTGSPMLDGSGNPIYSHITSPTDGNIDNSVEFNTETDAIKWYLRKSDYLYSYDEATTDGSKVTVYHYELTYRVRLKNELSDFSELSDYFTNDSAVLTYIYVENDVAGQEQTIAFKKPEVKGFLVDLEFKKTSALTKTSLDGAKFKLEHLDSCECGEYKYAPIDGSDNKYEVTSLNGVVSFKNIPSGHTYLLSESYSPSGYSKSTDKYIVKAEYDNVIIYKAIKGNNGKYTIGAEVNLSDFSYINTPVKADLIIKKTVDGSDTSGKFKFEIKFTYNDENIDNIDDVFKNFKYTKDDNETEYDLSVEDGIVNIGSNNSKKAYIELESGHFITIKDLPVGISYEVKELNSDGYSVFHCIDSDTSCVKSSNSHNGNKTSKNVIKEDLNKVEFVNIGGYVLPEAGSSGMLILTVCISVLLGVPIIYLVYSFIKKRI